MSNNYSYPRVDVTTTALKHGRKIEVAEDTTNLFVPILAEKGPVKELTSVHSLGEYISTFGNLSFESQGRTALQLANWLNSGGTAYIWNVCDGDNAIFEGSKYIYHDEAWYTIEAEAKYPGAFYNGLKINITKVGQTGSNLVFDIVIKKDKEEVDKYRRIKVENFDSIGSLSDYIKEIRLVRMNNDTKIIKKFSELKPTDKFADEAEASSPSTFNVDQFTDELAGASDASLTKLIANNFTAKVTEFWNSNDSIDSAILNELSAPIDLILDPGYSWDVKSNISNHVESIRPDIFTMYSFYSEKIENDEFATSLDEDNVYNETRIDDIYDKFYKSDDNSKLTSRAIYAQKLKVVENSITKHSKEIEVAPTYFLASLIPSNDLLYGIQRPTAGTTRGKLTGAISINSNPLPKEKNEYFLNRVNYIEKDTRGYYLMSQRTFDSSTEDEYTALSFINNKRCLDKMTKDIKSMGRDYLFEFNDSVTLSQLSSILNKYISTWIANRTLEKGVVTVAKNPYSEEAVDVTLSIKFTGTIEVISVDITIE